MGNSYKAKHRADGPSTMQLNQHALRKRALEEAARQVPVIPGPDGSSKPSESVSEPSSRRDYVPSEQGSPRETTVDYPWPERGKKISFSVMDIPSNLW